MQREREPKPWIVAVHAGAGRHGRAQERALLALLRAALARARSELLCGPRTTSEKGEANPSEEAVTPALRAAVAALGVLERSELSNCGNGASLTEFGRVECEASVVCGRSKLLGACAGVRGVAEPSALALKLVEQAAGSEEVKKFPGVERGRQPPLVVVGEYTRELARGFGLETATDEELEQYQVTDASKKHWEKWKKLIEGEEGDGGDLNDRMDTVGAVVMDQFGNVAAALSSGGIAFKTPGRVGLAGCPGMGCTASNVCCHKKSKDGKTSRKRRRRDRNSFAVACSGRGEHFIRSGLLSKLSRRLNMADNVESALRKSFRDAAEDNGGEQIEGGALALLIKPPSLRAKKRLRVDHNMMGEEISASPSVHVQLGVAFSTPSMGVGFLHSAEADEPRVQVLRRSESKEGEPQDQLALHVSFLTL